MSHLTCVVVFEDGTVCSRRSVLVRGWCAPCYDWSRHRGGQDPNGRRTRRKNGEVIAVLQAAAKASGSDCMVLSGYAIRPHVKHEGKWMNASRAVWIIANGDPGESHVLHTCNGGSGQSGCISIAHLYLGDAQQNVNDMCNSGRKVNAPNEGEQNGNAVLTEDAVRQIRARYVRYARADHPDSKEAMAIEFGVCVATIGRAARGESWKVVSD